MRRYFKFLTALALALCAAAAYADPPGRVGRVNHASGAVSFAPAEAPDQWVQAPLNRPLTAGDRLWSDAGSRAELHIGSTALRMGAQTNVDVLNLDDHTIQLRLPQGDLTARVRDLQPGDRIEIATPSGAVLIHQPGSYRVNVDPQSDSTRVVVNFGQAQVMTPAQTLNVPSSQALWFANGAPPQFEVVNAASADALDRWSAERDRREDRIASTRYVSPYMTGYEDLDQYGAWRSYPEYGTVWVPTRVASGWAPYRHGHWAWISPWGWTWVDDAPWGFAPFHYGRWVHVNGYWAWAPGTYVARPVYAPALVAFIGGSNFRVSVSSGPAVGWFPLGWREPYRPWYNASPTYVRNVNVTHVTNVTNITNITYVNQANPQAVTVVPQQSFVSSRPVAQAAVQVQPSTLTQAQVVQAAPAQPVRASFAAQDRRGNQPPATATAREVVAVTAPAKPALQASVAPQSAVAAQGAASASATPSTQVVAPQSRGEHEPRVRLIARDRAEARAGERGTERSAAQTAQPAAPASAPATSAPASATAATPAPAAAPAAAAGAGAGAGAGAAASATSPAPAARVAAPPAPTIRADDQRGARERVQATPADQVARPPERVARPPERQERDRREFRRDASAEIAQPQARVEAPKALATPEAPRPQLARPEPQRPQPQALPAEPPRAQVARPEPQRPQPLPRAEPPRAQPPQAAARPEPVRPQAQPQQRPEPPRQAPQAARPGEPPRERAQTPQERHRDRDRPPS